MAAVAVRKKVVSVGHFSPSFCFQSLQIFLFVILNQKQLIALKIRKKKDRAKWARWAKMLKITQLDNQLCSLTCFLVFASSHLISILLSQLKSEKKEWAKWAKWARILKNTHTEEHICSLTCLFLYLLAFKYVSNINLFLKVEIRKKMEQNKLSELECSKTPSQMSSYAH